MASISFKILFYWLILIIYILFKMNLENFEVPKIFQVPVRRSPSSEISAPLKFFTWPKGSSALRLRTTALGFHNLSRTAVFLNRRDFSSWRTIFSIRLIYWFMISFSGKNLFPTWFLNKIDDWRCLFRMYDVKNRLSIDGNKAYTLKCNDLHKIKGNWSEYCYKLK